MEHAEMSINANANGGFAGMDAHKKALISENSEMESGYVSNWSISHSHVTASTSGLSSSANFRSSSSFKRSVDLETISENNEPKDLQETPTTQSIRTLNEFHINTPQNSRGQLDTTPKKGNIFSNHYASRSGGKRNRSQNNFRWSDDRSGSSFFESIDENTENIFNDEGTNACNQSIGVSPIKPHNISHSNTQQSEKSQSLQRHPSGIESSTPKMTLKRTRTQSIVKPKANLANELTRDRFIRKAQSFSPAKRSALRETNFRHSIDPDDILVEIDEPQVMPNNPVRKVLEFSNEKFNQLTQQSRPPVNSSSPAAEPMRMKRLESQKSQSRLVKEFSRKKTTKPMVQTPNKTLGSLNESDILASLATGNETDLHKPMASTGTDDSVMDISDSSIQTPSTSAGTSTNRKQFQGILSDTPIRDTLVKKSIREDANRTPTKRFEKSISHNFLSVKSSPEKERFDIVYGRLPCTPPKNRQRRPLKRPAARIDSPLATEPSAKRKLYENHSEQPENWMGIEMMDILTRLKMRNLGAHIQKILSHLPDKSLVAASNVCKSWKAIVEDDPESLARRRRYLRDIELSKENLPRYDLKSNNINNNNIKPLHHHNKNYKVEEKPAPVSPSTRRFNEHQQTIQNLKPEQRVLQCPRCNGASIVHPATGNEAKAQRRSPRRHPLQMSILQDRSLRSSTNSATRIKRTSGITKVVISEFAACSKKACGYAFCTNCNCDRHINAKCTKRPLGSSPKSDEDSPYKPEPRHTKRDLRRLGRLVF